MHQDLIEEQRSSNRSALAHFDSFASHRERLTALLVEPRPPESEGRLCVLGAGNAYDLDLERLAAVYREIHLVDIDEAALTRARERQNAATRARLVLHAPLDLSGLLERLAAWRNFEVTPAELASYPETASNEIVDRLPAPFDVVVSACVLTQMQHTLLAGIPDAHRLFEPSRQLLNVMHLRTLAKLAAPGGRAVLATDVSSSALFSAEGRTTDGDGRALLTKVLEAGNVFYVAHPELLQWMAREDPVLRRIARVSPPRDAWLWHNGTHHSFLVYALEITRPPPATDAEIREKCS
jgi:SAM-dependent methyltransferase